MREIDVIHALRRRLRLSDLQRGGPFETDAEIVDLDGRLVAITLDEFSAEDRLPADDAERLGWNLVVATLSDLLAAGAAPRFMLNALVTAPWMDATYLEGLSQGMQAALAAHGAVMLGGDVGSGDVWRFSGVGVGTFSGGQSPRSRRTEVEAGAIVVTGRFGDGNLAAIRPQTSAPRFEVRCAEARALSPWPAAAMDTSDGLAPALETLIRCDARLRLEVDTEAVPLAEGVDAMASASGVPRAAFLLGSAGEYELVTLVPDDALQALARAGWTRIGRFTRASPSGLFFRHGEREARLPPLPDPRDAMSEKDYRERLVVIAEEVPCTPREGTSGLLRGRKERS